jgi:hypothetical protein
MSQIVRGLILGSPGPTPSAPLGDYYGAGSPLTSTDPIVLTAQIGSTYRDYVGGTFWFQSLTGWQQISIP